MKETPEGVEIGHDSLSVVGSVHRYELAEGREKVFAAGDRMFIGVSGDLRDLNLLRRAGFSVPRDVTTPSAIDSWVEGQFINVLTALMNRTGRVKNDDDEIPSMRSDILVAIDGRVYEIDEQFTVSRRSDGLYASGSGYEYALGALSAGASVSLALEIAAEHDVNTGGTLTTFTISSERSNAA